jgi:FkbM family methyltransferase
VIATRELREPVDAFDWVIVHKGEMGQYRPSFLLAAAERYRATFANEVFVVLSAHGGMRALKKSDVHVAAFRERLRTLPADGQLLADEWRSGQPWYWYSRLAGDPACTGVLRRYSPLPDSRDELERLADDRSRSIYLGGGVVLCRVLGRYLVYVDSEDVALAPHLAMNGYWEPWTSLALARLARPGARCVDVGANYGYFSLLLADAVGSEGRVLSVEPNPRVAELLTDSVGLNGFGDRVEVVRTAVTSDAAGRQRLVVPGRHIGGGSLRREPEPTDRAVEVETASLDELVADWPQVDVVKIDAEGSELDIWRGMTETLARNRDITVVMEYVGSHYRDPVVFVDLIQEDRFRLRYLEDDGSVHDIDRDELLSTPGRLRMLFLRR